MKFVKDKPTEVLLAYSIHGRGRDNVERVERLVAWTSSSIGWVKLNTDGASHGNPGRATAGGVHRDGAGNWYRGFALNIGFCSAPLAELWGVYYGLYMAWESKITRLEFEIDSEMVVGFLKTRIVRLIHCHS